MASVVVIGRRPNWRPTSVGIGSSLALSGGISKPPSYAEKDWNSSISTKPFCFPKVTSGEKTRAKSAPKVIDCWTSK